MCIGRYDRYPGARPSHRHDMVSGHPCPHSGQTILMGSLEPVNQTTFPPRSFSVTTHIGHSLISNYDHSPLSTIIRTINHYLPLTSFQHHLLNHGRFLTIKKLVAPSQRSAGRTWKSPLKMSQPVWNQKALTCHHICRCERAGEPW